MSHTPINTDISQINNSLTNNSLSNIQNLSKVIQPGSMQIPVANTSFSENFHLPKEPQSMNSIPHNAPPQTTQQSSTTYGSFRQGGHPYQAQHHQQQGQKPSHQQQGQQPSHQQQGQQPSHQQQGQQPSHQQQGQQPSHQQQGQQSSHQQQGQQSSHQQQGQQSSHQQQGQQSSHQQQGQQSSHQQQGQPIPRPSATSNPSTQTSSTLFNNYLAQRNQANANPQPQKPIEDISLQVYKKGDRLNGKSRPQTFNPFTSKSHQPENCGFIGSTFVIFDNRTKFFIVNSEEERQYDISMLKKIFIPQNTVDYVKKQKTNTGMYKSSLYPISL
jgi:hypothetical protein